MSIIGSRRVISQGIISTKASAQTATREALFSVSSILCAEAWSLQSLLVFRILQGLAGGLQATTRRFLGVILLPLVVRALFGEDLAALRAEAAAHISQSVAFFLAACRQGDGDQGPAQRLHDSSAGATGQMANSDP